MSLLRDCRKLVSSRVITKLLGSYQSIAGSYPEEIINATINVVSMFFSHLKNESIQKKWTKTKFQVWLEPIRLIAGEREIYPTYVCISEELENMNIGKNSE